LKELLPIGSIVLLEGGEKKLMIYGRLQQQEGTDIVWNYIGCLYPEGNINNDFTYLFNHDNIREVCFEGYRDEEENKIQKVIQQAIEDSSVKR
jgi:hypothetical protein